MQQKPQVGKKHPDEWNRDLNPDRMAGQNIGQLPEGRETGRTAYDVKAIHRTFDGFNDAELKQIPVLEPGTRLRQGATYLEVQPEGGGQFTATGDMAVSSEQLVIPKERVPYDIWNKLIGEEKPR
jgi:hypothetical protein